MWGLLQKSRTLRLPLLLPPFLQKGGGGWGLGMHFVLLPLGLPLLPFGLFRVRGVEVPLDARPLRASSLLSPHLLRGLRIQERLARSGRLLPVPPLPRLALPAHHCTLCEVKSRESLRRPAPVLDLPALPSLLAEKHGKIVEPALGWLALMTNFVGRALAPLPFCSLAGESVVDGSRRNLLPPVKGLGVTGRGLRTATGLTAFAPVRGPAGPVAVF